MAAKTVGSSIGSRALQPNVGRTEYLLHVIAGALAWPLLLVPMELLASAGHVLYSALLTLAVPTAMTYAHYRLERRMSPLARLRAARANLLGLLLGAEASFLVECWTRWGLHPLKAASLSLSLGVRMLVNVPIWGLPFLAASLLCSTATASSTGVSRPMETVAHAAAVAISGGIALALASLVALGGR